MIRNKKTQAKSKVGNLSVRLEDMVNLLYEQAGMGFCERINCAAVV